MILSSELREQLDNLWERLQSIQKKYSKQPLTQADIDEYCIRWLDTAITIEEETLEELEEDSK